MLVHCNEYGFEVDPNLTYEGIGARHQRSRCEEQYQQAVNKAEQRVMYACLNNGTTLRTFPREDLNPKGKFSDQK